jgi:adenosylmethionine-8-amino-7-oxononanoate aminotransferase
MAARQGYCTGPPVANSHGLMLRLVANRMAFSPPLIIGEGAVMARRLKRALDDTWTAVRAN